MEFLTRRRRSAPMVIIISLIDVLIVVLIFLMVTTNFKRQPAIKIVLPESRAAKEGANEEALLVSIPKDGPIYLERDPVTLEALQTKLSDAVRKNKALTLAIKSDAGATVGQFVKVVDIAKTLGIKVAILTQPLPSAK
jgi:biopolymer transport protein ExbD